ncbi:MAG TPA: LPS-assembly protein LptD [Gammaproteobacteria bacterium]|nr:LPS-assembly protein LptD [Gammaproteobacteria bacterium]
MTEKTTGPGRHAIPWMILILLSITTPAQGGTSAPSQWALCTHHIPAPEIEDTRGETLFTADSGTIFQNEIYELFGNIVLERDNKRFISDNITYFHSTEQAVAPGAIRYEMPDLIVEGDSAYIQLDDESGTISNARFQIPQRHAHGAARKLSFDGDNHTKLRQASYTTCDPEDVAWRIKASDINLNHDTQVGTARHAVLYFKKIPFFYVPYATFPLSDDRKSGFLTPAFGNSSKSGREFALPYYLNIAPNLDATLTPNYFSKRGLMLKGELRYLTGINHGQLNVEYLPSDNIFGDQERGSVNYIHKGNPFPRINTSVEYNYISDSDYLNDFGRNLSKTSQTHLPQRASLDYRADSWAASIRLQDFQTVDKTIPDRSRPYQLLPKFTFDTTRPETPNKPNFELKTELVNFQRQGRINGRRLDIRPGLSFPLSNTAAFFKPALKYQYTAYALSDQAAGQDDNPERQLPLYSVDSGIFLEKEYDVGGKQFLNTLEPRLYYLYVPYRDQSEIPVFDSGQPDFNYNQLFRENRFTSSDRVGDANQLTAAITSRLLNERGEEQLKIRAGQIFYFRDRKVSLKNSDPETSPTSAIVSELNLNISNRITSTADMRWDTDKDQVDKGNIRLRYHPGYRRLFNISYRYRSRTLQQTDMSLLWPLNPHWHVIGRWVRSILDSTNLETLGGFEYQNCCWKFHFVTRRFLRSDESYDTTYFVQLEFKGLTRIGKDVDDVLENGILGYEK